MGLLPDTVFAHLVNTDVGVFYAGMLHPLTSAEHLLPTLALALLSSQSSKRTARVLMFLFPIALVVGLFIGSRFSGVIIAGLAHPVNLITLMLLGGLLIVNQRINMAVVISAALITGLILGYRSGVDMSAAKVDLKFIPGVALTGFVAIVLFSAWIPQSSTRSGNALLVLAGVCLLIAGGILAANPFLAGDVSIIREIRFPTEESLTGLVKNREMTFPVIIVALLGATAWGAAHALTPGHGKAIVAAYLVGASSTPWHALYLGITVTITHTIGVFGLGLISLFASRYILAEQLYPWLGALSGVIIIGLAASMMINRFRSGFLSKKASLTPQNQGSHEHYDHEHSHSHDHSHLPPGTDDTPVTWRSLLGLGISGGLLPCPSALVLLLTAVSLQRVGLGILLVAAFSLGMASVLMAVGLLFVKGSGLMTGTNRMTVISRYLPIGSAVIILCLGLILTFDSIMRIAS